MTPNQKKITPNHTLLYSYIKIFLSHHQKAFSTLKLEQIQQPDTLDFGTLNRKLDVSNPSPHGSGKAAEEKTEGM